MAGQVDLGKVVGDNGQGVPTGGTTGQILKKISNSNYDTGWWTPGDAAGKSVANNLNTSSAGVSVLDAKQGAMLANDIGVVEETNTATHNITAGQYVIWKGALYTASTNIASGATLSTSNLTAVAGGGLNALNNAIMDKARRTNYTVAGNSSSAIPIPSNTRAFIVTSGTAGTQKSMIILSASSGGSVAYAIVCQGNDVSYNDAVSNQLTVTNGNNNALAVTIFFMNV